MCGIVGVISGDRIDPQVVCRMRDQLEHRGPDHAGLWQSPDQQVCLGHRRLAILDLSSDANQPFVSADGRLVITFNGEIYNFEEIRKELASQGVRFRTRSDTEVLLEAFRFWGERCLDRLSGMFAFAIWDAAERRLFCARDRAGEKPFHYTCTNGAFLFGSEIKAIALWPAFPRKIHYPAVIDYLTFGFIPDPKTIWEGCLKLPPGHFMWVEAPEGGVPTLHSPRAYWDFEIAPDYSVTDWEDRIRTQLEAAANSMTIADVPVGTFLSGGVDSSSVTAALSRQGRQTRTFTVGFQDSAFDERPWAAEVARLYATSHSERTVDAADAAGVFQKLLWHYDEPFNDYSYVPTFYVCREARKSITVALSGDGGDELFAGYSKYRRLSLREQFGHVVPTKLATPLVAGACRLLPGSHPWRRKLAAYGKDLSGALIDTLTTSFPIGHLRAAARGPLAEALRHFHPRDTVVPLLQKAPPQKVGAINSMRYLDLKLTLAGDMLVKVDRASMAVALEVRPVYLHRDIMDLAARIPPGLLADRQQSKKLLKSSLRPWLPDSILYRPKMGFAMPLQKWLNGNKSVALFADGARTPIDDWLDVARLESLARAAAAESGGSALLAHSLFFLRNWTAMWNNGANNLHL